MKIRQGFVSNSSSSSFIILGKDVDILKVTPKMIKEKIIMVVGETLCEGEDIFQIRTDEQLAFLKALNKISIEDTFKYIDTYAMAEDEYEGEIDVKKLPKTGKIKYYNFNQDFSSSEDLRTLQMRYDKYENTNAIMQRYLRGKKLIKINKNV